MATRRLVMGMRGRAGGNVWQEFRALTTSCSRSSAIPAQGKPAKREAEHTMRSEFGAFGKYVLPPHEHLQFDDQGHHGRLHTRGIGVDMLNRHGHLNPWKVFRVSEYIHKCVMLDTRFALGEFTRPRTSIVAITKVTFHPALYANPGRAWFGRPLILGQKLLDLGKSSFLVLMYIEDAETGVCLADNLCKGMVFDLETGRPAEIPVDLKSSITEQLDPLAPKLTYSPATRPDHAYVLPHVVASSDIDANMHLNNNAYPRLCWDAAAMAVYRGRFRHFTGDLSSYRPRQWVVNYLQEGKMGDSMPASAWEDPDDSLAVHFQLDRRDKPALRSTLHFYSRQEVTQQDSGQEVTQ